MLASIAPVSPSVAVPPTQPVEDSAAVGSATNASSATNYANFLEQFTQTIALQDTEQLIDAGNVSSTPAITLSQGDDGTLLDSAVLTNLSPQALAALSDANEVATIPTTGNLSATQLAELVTLQDDAQILNSDQSITFAGNVVASNSSSTITLSPQAVELINAANAVASAAAITTAGNALTSAQLQQIAGIVAPVVNQPLTLETLTQLHNAVTAAGFNPVQLSLQTIFLSMNYLAEFSAISQPDEDGEQRAANEMVTAEFEEPA
jgi:hypothetical protein